MLYLKPLLAPFSNCLRARQAQPREGDALIVEGEGEADHPLLLELDARTIRNQQQEAAHKNFQKSNLGKLMAPVWLERYQEGHQQSFADIYQRAVTLYKRVNNLPAEDDLNTHEALAVSELLCGQRNFTAREAAQAQLGGVLQDALENLSDYRAHQYKAIMNELCLPITFIALVSAPVLIFSMPRADRPESTQTRLTHFFSTSVKIIVGSCGYQVYRYIVHNTRTCPITDALVRTLGTYLTPEGQERLGYREGTTNIRVSLEILRQISVLNALDNLPAEA